MMKKHLTIEVNVTQELAKRGVITRSHSYAYILSTERYEERDRPSVMYSEDIYMFRYGAINTCDKAEFIAHIVAGQTKYDDRDIGVMLNKLMAAAVRAHVSIAERAELDEIALASPIV